MLHPTVFNTAQICSQLGVKHAVMSPGSRNAPLTISFARHQEIQKWIIPDERSAGFVALGIAQESKSPVVLCCTSGTALLNYAPAIAEAYYREIPLIVLSADRPPELIDQRDGQTIRQFGALSNHVKKSIQLPIIDSEQNSTLYSNLLVEALNESLLLPAGPVHVNIPFAEPFYPEENSSFTYKKLALTKVESASIEHEEVAIDLKEYRKVLILIGQNPNDQQLEEVLKKFSSIPIVKFPLNNLSKGIDHVDLFIDEQQDLRPDLLITSGLSVLSKKLKLFLRANKPQKHLHFDPAGVPVDTFATSPEVIRSSVDHFLKNHEFTNLDSGFIDAWKSYEQKTKHALAEFQSQSEFSETGVAKMILDVVPKNSNLHLSNSMPVRYADMFGVGEAVECFSNRGTSGIDGCTSTAVGSSLISDKLNILITGDLAFLYDRNAFFHNYHTPNLRVIVLNNQGGGIFRLIPGPSKLPELEEYFETRHNRTAEYICAENSLLYFRSEDFSNLENDLSTFFLPASSAKVLEVFSNPETNQRVYKDLKKYINERIKD